MWSERYHVALAKTSHGGQSLYDHTMQCVEVGLRLSKLAADYPKRQLDLLIFALSIHDIGKLDPNFQAMLRANLEGRALPAKKVKHESRTFSNDHVSLVEGSLDEIAAELRGALGYKLLVDGLVDNLEWAWTYAVAHHGLYYLSYERSATGELRPHARRLWTTFNPLEIQRRTLVDVLFYFHPLGGLVIMADLIATLAYEHQLMLPTVFREADTFGEVYEELLYSADELETILQRDDPRNYGLYDLLCLLGSGVGV